MSNRVEQLLDTWYDRKDSMQWMLATVVETAGSSYRKKGAMMFFNDLGQCFGLVSGGCLEADIMRQAQKNWSTGQPSILTYDMRDEDDIGWQLGIGCGGMVKLLLQPISEQNDYLQLTQLRHHLAQRRGCYYLQSKQPDLSNQCLTHSPVHSNPSEFIVHYYQPRPQVVIFGGGVDALPVSQMCATLGWQQVLVDKRVGYGRPSVFDKADFIYSVKTDSAELTPLLETADAIIIMTHNVAYDAEALAWAQSSHARFVGMLGPKHRTEKVLKAANIQQLKKPLANPIGLDIGGELPEAIALSITAQIQAVLENKMTLCHNMELQRVV